MSRKSDQTKPDPDPPKVVPTLSFSFLRVFSAQATGSIGIVAASILSTLGMVALIALVIFGKELGYAVPKIAKFLGPLWAQLTT